MGDQRQAIWADATLRRPALDPGIPRPDRDLLAARGALLTPAGQDRPARRRYYLPTEPARRLATIDGNVTGLTAGEFIHTFGDAHIYANHLDQVAAQLEREPLPLPHLEIDPAVSDLARIEREQIRLAGYRFHPALAGEVAV